MRLPSKETLALLRSRYPKGARVELVRMDDPQAPPVGTRARCWVWTMWGASLWHGTTAAA